MAADPTYPLFPITAIVCAACMFLVLTTSFVRQSWSLGVLFLSFWIFWELLFNGINAVIWSDNADIKLLVYCDIGEFLARLRAGFLKDCCSFACQHVYFRCQARMYAHHHSTAIQSYFLSSDGIVKP
jgi:hypothetical protein